LQTIDNFNLRALGNYTKFLNRNSERIPRPLCGGVQVSRYAAEKPSNPFFN
jgi:hypothetical protein